jgi:hypothetical protein
MTDIAMQDAKPESMSTAVKVAKAQAKANRAERDPERLTTLRFTCQGTGKSFDHDVPGDAETLRDLWPQHLMLSCPHCGEVHGFSFRTAYVQAMLAEPRLSFERISATA